MEKGEKGLNSVRKFEGKYLDLPEDVLDKITEDEFVILQRIQDSLFESVKYINNIFDGEDLHQSLYYIVHDWIGEHGKESNRNYSLISELNVVSDLYDRIETHYKMLQKARELRTVNN